MLLFSLDSSKKLGIPNPIKFPLVKARARENKVRLDNVVNNNKKVLTLDKIKFGFSITLNQLEK